MFERALIMKAIYLKDLKLKKVCVYVCVNKMCEYILKCELMLSDKMYYAIY